MNFLPADLCRGLQEIKIFRRAGLTRLCIRALAFDPTPGLWTEAKRV
jgi:hypothetical protein